MTVLLLAHRGASARFPENTLAAFHAAFDPHDDADGIECDVRLSSDGVPFVFHDDTTERLTGAPGAVHAMTAAELGRLNVGGHPIPTLEQLAHLLRDHAMARPTRPLLWNVELKANPLWADVPAALPPILAHLPPSVETVISSFDPRLLAASCSALPSVPHALLIDAMPALRALPYLPANLDLHPHHSLAAAVSRTLDIASSSARRLRVWTVDTLDEAHGLDALGVSAVITNRPHALHALRT